MSRCGEDEHELVLLPGPLSHWEWALAAATTFFVTFPLTTAWHGECLQCGATFPAPVPPIR